MGGTPLEPRILFVSNVDLSPGLPPLALYSADLDLQAAALRNVRRLTPESALFPYQGPFKVPRQERVVFAMSMGSPLYTDIWSIPLGGATTPEELTRLTSNETRNNILPSMPEVGDELYYVSETRDSEIREVRRMRLDGSNAHVVTSVRQPVTDLRASPDGRALILGLLDPKNRQTDLFVLEPPGAVLRPLTATPQRNEHAPAFDAQGRVLFLAGSDIYSVGLDGTGEQKLTPGDFPYNGPLAPLPDGTGVIFQADINLYLHDFASGANRRLTEGGIFLQHSLF